MKKQTRAAALLLAFVMSVGVPPFSIQSYADYAKVDGSYRMLDGTAIEGVYTRGIDVSHWQGEIDWNAVANDDVHFVMHGTRYAGDIDPRFHTNVKNAVAAGLDVGVYIYSYATDVAMAEAEADFVLSLIKDYKISYPVAFDMEDSVQNVLTDDERVAMANAFCKKIEDAGYYPIIYANDYWLANKLDMSRIPYPVWVARYQQMHIYENPIIWQATSTGKIGGISGNVDIDFQYKDLTEYLPANLWRTIFGTTYYYQNYERAKDTWVNHDNARYYIQSDGTAYRGWRQEDGAYYLLQHSNGQLATGWYQENGSWYYLAPETGVMTTGWQVADGQWYYLSPSNGVMQTGWTNQNGTRYYLRDSGAMATGWRQLNDQWYYFTPGSGEINNSGWKQIDNEWYYLAPETGILHTSGWLYDGGAWYYSNSSGSRQTGLVDVNGVLYYLDPSSGVMYADTTVVVGDTTYIANTDGSLSLPPEPEALPEVGESAQPEVQQEVVPIPETTKQLGPGAVAESTN